MPNAKLVIVFKSGAIHSIECTESNATAIAGSFYSATSADPTVEASNINMNLYGSSPNGTIRARASDISAILVERV